MATISKTKSEQQNNLMNVTRGEVTQTIQMTMQQASTLDNLSEIQAIKTQTITSVDSNTSEETRRATNLLHTTPTTSAATPSMNTKIPPTRSTGTTTVQLKILKSTTRVPTTQISKQINNSTQPLKLSKITQSHDKKRISSTQVKIKEMTSLLTSTPGLTAIQMETTSIKHEEKRSKITKPVPSTIKAWFSPSETSTVTHINKTKKKDSVTGKVVAAIIGSALFLMIAGFLLICIQKERLQKQQKNTTWGGPSPLLEGEANNGNGVLGTSSRISLNSFLPHRLSKRLSLLPETNEMKDITSRATLEEKHTGSTFGQAMDRNDAQEKKITAAAPEIKTGSETEEIAVVSVAQTTVVN